MRFKLLYIKSVEFHILLSFLIGILLLGLKGYVFTLTTSTAVLADFYESVVHLFVVGFAAFSVCLAKKPADKEHHYGHDRIAFFSAGFEGAMILGAALSIFYHVLTTKSSPTHLEEGIRLFFLTFIVNGFLGFYLRARGKAFANLILEANGKHLLADCISSGGVLAGLLLVKFTKLTFFDPLFAALVALHILWTGMRLLKSAVHGLMDRADPEIHKKIVALFDEECAAHKIQYHRLRHRLTGNRIHLDVHLLFPKEFSLVDAHEIATEIEKQALDKLAKVDVVSHLEPIDGHDAFHELLLGKRDYF